MLIISIYRAGVTIPILSAKPNDDNSLVRQQIMGENILSLNFYLDHMVELRIGDYTDVYGSRWYVHASKVPAVNKDSKYGYEFTLEMVSAQYLLQNAQYLTKDDAGIYTVPSFSLYETAEGFINLLLANAARLGISWIKGGVIQTEYKNLTFDAKDCLSALQYIAEQFETEWYVDGTTINLAKKLNATPYTFRYGKGKGNYEIKREPASTSSIVTRLYVFGGTKNIPIEYRNGAQRLLLPAVTNPLSVSDVTYNITNNGNGTQTMVFGWTAPADPSVTKTTVNMRLTTGTDTSYKVYQQNAVSASPTSIITVPIGIYEVFFEMFTGASPNFTSVAKTQSIIVSTSSPYPVLPGADQPYIQHNTDLYGVIEQTLIYDDIYPHRTGKVTAVDATNPYVFSDASMDFNVNDYLLPGTAAKVTFNTGQLAGYTFEIKSGGYNDNTKQFTLLKNKDEKTLDIPSQLFRPAIGDEYVLVDIYMPQSYIDAAEAQLLAKAQNYLNTFSVPAYNYSIVCDPKYFRQQKIKLSYGDVVQIEDTELNVNRGICITSVTKRLDDEYNYSLELGDTVSISPIAQIQNNISGNTSQISDINSNLNNNRQLNGTYIGDYTIEQGTLVLKDVETAGSTAGLKPLYIDADGKVFKV